MDAIDLAAAGDEILLAQPAAVDRVMGDARRVRTLLDEGRLDNLIGAPGDRRLGYKRHRDIALIPIKGALIPNGPVGLARFGVTSYEGLREELRWAVDDPEVATIVLMVDSPGGYVNGVDATADAVLAARRSKPVVAVVEGMAASAAYWLAAQADRIVAARFGTLGSIGALQVHVDASRALDAAGLTVTIVRAGARKAEGSPFEPLGDNTRADLQASLDRIRLAFAQAVVSGRDRPQLDLEAVLGTEARMFDADEAVALGLADRIGTLDKLVAAMPAASSMRRSVLVTAPAIEELPQGGVARRKSGLGADPGLVEAEVQPAPLPDAAAIVAPAAPGGAPAAAGDPDRLAAILAHPFAQTKGGLVLARYYAFKTAIGATEAIASMESFADLAEQHRVPTLEEEMAADPASEVANNVGASGGPSPGELPPAVRAAMATAQVLGKDPREVLAKGASGAVTARRAEPTRSPEADAAAFAERLPGGLRRPGSL